MILFPIPFLQAYPFRSTCQSNDNPSPAHPPRTYLTLIRSEKYHSDREAGFNNRFGVASHLTSYNALYDPNMRHFFENSVIQSHLYRSGQIDKAGRVIDLDKNKSKVRGGRTGWSKGRSNGRGESERIDSARLVVADNLIRSYASPSAASHH